MPKLLLCTKCPLHKCATNILVPGKGAEEPTIMFVGIAPGWQEDKDGECFIGKAGQKLMELIAAAGIDLDICRFSNLVRCVPWKDPKNTRKGVRDPNDDEIEACQNYLLKEIALHEPNIIVPLGKVPTLYFLPHLGPNMKITKVSGTTHSWEHPLTDDEYTVIPTLHPAAVCRTEKWRGAVLSALAYVGDLATGRSSADIFADCDYQYLDTIEKVSAYVDMVIAQFEAGKIPAVSIDVETGFIDPLPEDYPIDRRTVVLNPYNPHHTIVSVQLSHGPKKGALIPLWHKDSPLRDAYSINMIAYHLQRALDVVPVIGQNYKFDMQVLYVMLNVMTKYFLFDAMLAQYLVYQKSQPLALEDMAGMYVDMPFFKREMHKALEALPEEIRHMGNVDMSVLIRYGVGDADAVYRLYEYWKPILEDNGLWEVYQSLLRDATLSYARVEINGMAIDPKRLAKLSVDYAKELAELLKEIRKCSLIDEFNQIMREDYDEKVELKYARENAKREKEGRPPVRRKKWTPEQQLERDAKIAAKLVFKPSSPNHLRLMFYDDRLMNFPTKGKGLTKGKQVKADKNARKLILEDAHSSLEALRERKQTKTVLSKIAKLEESIETVEFINTWVGKNKLYTAYVKSAPSLIQDKEDIERDWPIHLPGEVYPWCFHANFKVHGSETGRRSCADPNLQQMPYKSLIKWMFISRWKAKGGLLLQSDYSQSELRVLAKLCDEKTMLDAFNRGEDIHMFVARLVFGKLGVPADQIDKSMRRIAKRASFGIVYGQGAKALAYGFGTSIDEAKEIIKTLYTVFPNLRGWMDEKIQECKDNGLVTTPMGRIRWIKGASSRDDYVAAEAARKAVNTPIQCLPGSTRVYSTLGCKSIRDLEDVKSVNLQINGDLYTCKGISNSGRKKIVRITLGDGKIIESSKDHKWAVFDYPDYKWVPAQALTKDDYLLSSMESVPWGNNKLSVVVDKGRNRWGNNYGSGNVKWVDLPDRMTKELAEVVGKLVSDGYYSKRGRLAIVDVDLEAIHYYADYLRSLKLYVGISNSSKYKENATRPLWKATADSVQLWTYLKESWGLDMVSGPGVKSTPTEVFRSTSSIRAAYLRGLFQGDGIMSPDGFPIFCSTSEKLCRETQELLATLGIASTVRSYEDGYYWKTLVIKISAPDFMKKIGFRGLKHREYRKRLRKPSNKAGQRLTLDGTQVKAWGEAIRPFQRNMTKGGRSHLHRLLAGSGSWKGIIRCAREADYKLPSWFLNNRPVKVEAVDITDSYVEMFDVVDSEHSHRAFIANGIVCHNSASADWTLASLNEIVKRLDEQKLKSLIVATIHDSIMVDVYPGELLRVMDIMHHEMVIRLPERFDWIKGVTPKTDFEFGIDWKSMTDIEVQPDLTYKVKGIPADIKKNVKQLAKCGGLEQLDFVVDEDSPEDSWALIDIG